MIEKVRPYFYFGNLFIFVLKVVLFFWTKSYAFLISSFYNLCIGLAKREVYSKKNNYRLVGFFVMIASLCFVVYSIYVIIVHKIVAYNIYSGITIAAVTFYDIGYSIYGIGKSIKNRNEQNNILKLVNLATALISLELTQSALLSFTQINIDNSLYNGLLGLLVSMCSFFIGGSICFRSNKKYNIK